MKSETKFDLEEAYIHLYHEMLKASQLEDARLALNDLLTLKKLKKEEGSAGGVL